MNSQRSRLEIVGLPTREQLDHMLKVPQTVVDRCCRQHDQNLSMGDIEETPVAGRRNVSLASNSGNKFSPASYTGVSEVMGLVNNDYVGQFPHPLKAFWEFVASA